MKHGRIRTAHVHAAISLCALVSIASPGGAQAAQRNSARRPPAQPVLGARVAKLLEQDGLRFRDLNRNGRVDPYEDWRLTPDARARDLTGRMTLAEKAGAMMHSTKRFGCAMRSASSVPTSRLNARMPPNADTGSPA